MLAELNEILVQLRHFCGTFRRISEIFRITPCFSSVGSSNVVDVAHTGVIWSCFEVFSFNLFIACIVLAAHNIVELLFEREWVENESVDKDYPQKMISESHYCNHQYPLRTSSQNIVFVPGELSGASRNRYVFDPYQFHNTFLGIPKVYVGVPWNILGQIQKFNVCKFPCNSVSGDEVDHSFCCGGWWN